MTAAITVTTKGTSAEDPYHCLVRAEEGGYQVGVS